MAESNGRNAPEVPISPGTQHRLTLAVAGTIAAIAIVLAILIALRTPQYETEARLAYTAPGANSANSTTVPGLATAAPAPTAQPETAGAATAMATSVLSDAQLAHLIDQLDLFPQQRQRQSTIALAARMRAQLALTEPEPGVLAVSFKDSDQTKAQTVTNGVASLLAAYQVMVSVLVPANNPGIKSKHESRLARKVAVQNRAVTAVLPAPAPPPPRAGAPANNAYAAELSHQVDRVDVAMGDMEQARTELEAEQHQVAGKIEALEKAEHRAAEAHASGRSEAARSERSVAEQDLAAEKAKLAALRDRYTDAYPDVQSTEEEIANLQAKIARLPAAPAASEKVAPTAEQSEAMTKLREEKLRVERDLGQNRDAVEAEAQRKITLLGQLQQAKVRRPQDVQGSSASAVAPSPGPAPTNNADSSPQMEMISVPALPFRLMESAGTAALVTTSRLALSLWLALGTAILLALCFVPMVPAHYAAVVKTPEDLKQSMPEHVAYLGDVGRTEP